MIREREKRAKLSFLNLCWIWSACNGFGTWDAPKSEEPGSDGLSFCLQIIVQSNTSIQFTQKKNIFFVNGILWM